MLDQVSLSKSKRLHRVSSGSKLCQSGLVKSFLAFFLPLLSCFFRRLLILFHFRCYRYYAVVRNRFSEIHWLFYLKSSKFGSINNSFIDINYFSKYYFKQYLYSFCLSDIGWNFNFEQFDGFTHLKITFFPELSIRNLKHSYILRSISYSHSFYFFQKKSLLI